MSVFDHPDFDRHETVHFVDDPASGLKAVIAIHSTALGPAAGGCRRWCYASPFDAVSDVLRLSRGMTYKNALAGLPFGGGKSVILAERAAKKTPELFRAFGRAVESLGGRYISAEDVGVDVDDMQSVREETAYVAGLPQVGDGAGGDPSPWTALGVFLSLEAAVKARLGSESLSGVVVGVQGAGSVGSRLCELLAAAGARLVVADVNRDSLRRLADSIEFHSVAPTELVFEKLDVLAPCALGNILNAQSIPRIKAAVVAGAANNQLSAAEDGRRLLERGILYAPDYLINAGGVISVALEYLGQRSADEVRREVARIPVRLADLIEEAEQTKRPTNDIADERARRIVAASNSGSTPGTAVSRIA